MNTIQELYQQAQLAEAAYANFLNDSGNLVNEIGIENALGAEGMKEPQATDFVKHWTVVSQYSAPSIGSLDGPFSATLFLSKDTGIYTFAIRGTVGIFTDLLGADFGDLVMDGLPLDQLVDMYNYWQSLNHTGNYQAVKLEVSLTETAALKLLVGPVYDAAAAVLKASGAILDTTLAGIVVRRIVEGNSTTLLDDPNLEGSLGVRDALFSITKSMLSCSCQAA